MLKKSHHLDHWNTGGYRNSRTRNPESIKVSSWCDLKPCALKGINVSSRAKSGYDNAAF